MMQFKDFLFWLLRNGLYESKGGKSILDENSGKNRLAT